MMIYSKEEIRNLSEKELKKLVSFGDKETYFYKDISYFEDENRMVHFKNGTKIQAADSALYKTVKDRKIQYELNFNSFNNEGAIRELIKSYFNELNKKIDNTMEKLNKKMDFLKITVNNEVKEAIENFNEKTRSIQEINSEELNKNIKTLNKIIETLKNLTEL